MRKKLAILSMLCLFFLSGCSVYNTSKVDINMAQVYGYDSERENVTLVRNVGDYRLFIEIENYKDSDPDIHVTLYSFGKEELVAECDANTNKTEGVLKADVEVTYKNKGDGFLLIKDRVTYYAQEDREHNFTYDKYAKLEFYTSKSLPVIMAKEISDDDLRWNPFSNFSSVLESISLGVYSATEISFLIASISIWFAIIAFMIMVALAIKYRVMRETRFKKENVLNAWIVVVMFVLGIFASFQGEPFIIETTLYIVFFVLMLIRLVLQMMKLEEAKAYEIRRKDLFPDKK